MSTIFLVRNLKTPIGTLSQLFPRADVVAGVKERDTEGVEGKEAFDVTDAEAPRRISSV